MQNDILRKEQAQNVFLIFVSFSFSLSLLFSSLVSVCWIVRECFFRSLSVCVCFASCFPFCSSLRLFFSLFLSLSLSLFLSLNLFFLFSYFSLSLSLSLSLSFLFFSLIFFFSLSLCIDLFRIQCFAEFVFFLWCTLVFLTLARLHLLKLVGLSWWSCCFSHCSFYYVGASSYFGSCVSNLATWDFAEQKFSDSPLSILALDALSWVVFEISGTACPEMQVERMFDPLQSRLSSWQTRFSRKDTSITFCRGHLQNSIRVTQVYLTTLPKTRKASVNVVFLHLTLKHVFGTGIQDDLFGMRRPVSVR